MSLASSNKETESTQDNASSKPEEQVCMFSLLLWEECIVFLITGIKQEEAKLKTSKNMFKSEQDFLEFMIKYQQVLSERDSGK